MSLTFTIKLPPDGFIIRDFAITTLAHMQKVAEFNVEPTNVSVKITSPSDLANRYSEILQEISEMKNPRFYGPDNSAKAKVFHEVKILSGKSSKDISETIRNYAEWISKKPENIDSLLRSLETLAWNVLDDNVILWGQKPSIPALQLFKLNYYAGRRVFLPRRYQNARIYLDIHTFIFSIAGAILARVGVLRDGPTIYLSILDPGILNLFKVLYGLLTDVGYRITPEVIFRVLTTMRVAIPGSHPLRIAVINELGNRPALLTCHEVVVDRSLLRFIRFLPENFHERLQELLVFTLKNWESNDRGQRIIAKVGYELAQAIYMSATGALKPSDVIYHVARATYATNSNDFIKALTEAKGSPIRSIKEFQRLIIEIERSLERCFLAP